jgi:hypothetical protein
MPKSLKDLFLDKDYNVPFVEPSTKPENILNSELNKNRPLVQLGKNLPSIYGTDLVRIESRGSIDPARTIAVNSARPNKGVVGRFLSNLLGQGGAYRPSDTIFPADGSSPPVSSTGQPINGNWSGLKAAIDDSNTDYLVLQEPTKPSGIDKALNGLLKGNNPKEIAEEAVGRTIGVAQSLITKGLNKVLTSKRNNKNLIKVEPIPSGWRTNETNKKNEYVGSQYFKTYGAKTGNPNGEQELQDRNKAGIVSFDTIRDTYLLQKNLTKDGLQKLAKDNLRTQVAYLQIKQIGIENVLVFPAAINGVSEQINPEWDTFKYVGSPFNSHRYIGVNRKLSFGLQVYHLGKKGTNLDTQSQEMRDKLNKLRELAFPFNSLNKITYGKGDVSGLTFTPNLIELSLGDYYKNLNGFIDGIVIGIPDNVSWATNDPNLQGGGFVYPTVVNVQFSMTIVENHLIDKANNNITYRFTDVIDTNVVTPNQPNEPNDVGQSTYSVSKGFIGTNE